ncbi:hypothetical protein D3C78_1827900 [compost metagenome]
MALGARAPRIDGGHFDIALGREIGQQVVALEDEAEVFAPQLGEFVGRELSGFAPGDAVAAARGRVQAAEYVHQRRLA